MVRQNKTISDVTFENMMDFSSIVWHFVDQSIHQLIVTFISEITHYRQTRAVTYLSKSTWPSQSIDYQWPFNCSLIMNDSRLCIAQKRYSSRRTSRPCTVQFVCCSRGGEWLWAWPNRLAGRHSYKAWGSPSFQTANRGHSFNCLPFIIYNTTDKTKKSWEEHIHFILRGSSSETMDVTFLKHVRYDNKIKCLLRLWFKCKCGHDDKLGAVSGSSIKALCHMNFSLFMNVFMLLNYFLSFLPHYGPFRKFILSNFYGGM